MIICKKCDNTGFIVNIEANKSTRCECYEQRVMDNLCARAKIADHWRINKYPPEPMSHFRCRIGDKAQKLVKDFLGFLERVILDVRKNRGVYIYGQTGRGKSHMAYLILMEALKRFKVTGYATTETRLFRLVFDRTLEDLDIEESEAKTFSDRVENSEILLIDEMGSEPMDSKGYKDNWINRLIRSRYDRNLVTLMTSNVSPDLLRQQYGDRLSSFLKESALFIRFSSDKDYRTYLQELASNLYDEFIDDEGDDEIAEDRKTQELKNDKRKEEN